MAITGLETDEFLKYLSSTGISDTELLEKSLIKQLQQKSVEDVIKERQPENLVRKQPSKPEGGIKEQPGGSGAGDITESHC